MISDSGGIAEEVSVLKRPLVVVRNSTERPEVMGTFAVRVAAGAGIGAEARRLLEVGWERPRRHPEPLRRRLRVPKIARGASQSVL